jgi:putative NADPH-quinone reductase
MNKKILIIDGHPYDQSFCTAIAKAYAENTQQRYAQAKIQLLSLRDLEFDPILRAGYKKIQELEPDLVRAQELLKWADHIVIICPIWWGGPPALLKGFLDRIFLPGFAFKYRQNSKLWDKFMTGRSGHVIVTSDAPSWWMRWMRGDSTVRLLRESTLDFVGIKPVKVSRIGNIKWLSETQRKNILNGISY